MILCPKSCIGSSLWKKPISNGGKSLSSYREMFELAQGLWDYKTSDLNCSYEAHIQKEALTICEYKVFASFLCVLSLSSVLGRLFQLYCDTDSLGRTTPAWDITSPSPSFPTFSIYVLQIYYWGRGNSSDLKHFIVCF